MIRPSVVLISQANCALRPFLGPSLVPEKKDSAISVPVFVYFLLRDPAGTLFEPQPRRAYKYVRADPPPRQYLDFWVS